MNNFKFDPSYLNYKEDYFYKFEFLCFIIIKLFYFENRVIIKIFNFK